MSSDGSGPVIPKSDSFWTFGSLGCETIDWSRGSRPPSGAQPRASRGDPKKCGRWPVEFPISGAGRTRLRPGRARSPRRCRKDRFSKIHNLGDIGMRLGKCGDSNQHAAQLTYSVSRVTLQEYGYNSNTYSRTPCAHWSLCAPRLARHGSHHHREWEACCPHRTFATLRAFHKNIRRTPQAAACFQGGSFLGQIEIQYGQHSWSSGNFRTA